MGTQPIRAIVCRQSPAPLQVLLEARILLRAREDAVFHVHEEKLTCLPRGGDVNERIPETHQG